MAHLKSEKISFSLKEQFKKLQDLCGSSAIVGAGIKETILEKPFDYKRIFYIEPHNVGLALLIENDDKNKSGNIFLAMFRRVFVSHEEAIQFNFGHKTNSGNQNKYYFLKSKKLNYNELKKIIADMNKKPSILSAIDSLNEKNIFEMGFNLGFFFGTEHNFKQEIIKRNEIIVEKVKREVEDLLTAFSQNVSNGVLNQKEIEEINKFTHWNKSHIEMLNSPIDLAKANALSLKRLKRYVDVKKLNPDFSNEEGSLDYAIMTNVFGF
jgi:hypothetical protein